ncbi:MAG TPA: hypothetical protein VGG28_31215 [Kofleriaceae bacterium]
MPAAATSNRGHSWDFVDRGLRSSAGTRRALLACMTTIDLALLDKVTGGDFGFGYKAGTAVTQGLLDVGMPATACHQTGAPILDSLGFHDTANGARQAVIDTCARAGVPVK